ncbi:MAG: DUF4197 domain-containing protein [Cyclobacteriaceae bacterium]
MKRLQKIFLVTALISTTTFISCELFEDVTGPLPLTDAEIVEGLKEALSIGLDNSVTSASSVNGYLENEIIKILLPEEVVEVQNKIQTESVLGIPLTTVYDVYTTVENNGNDLFSELTTAMNKGAESAASKALPIFANAITSMSFSDALGILEGGETAATDYFFEQTNVALFTAFNPEVKTALDATGANQIYTTTVGFLNYEYDPTGLGLSVISPADVINVNLPASIDEYATNKAIDGLFYLIGEEEKKIRDDPFAWASSIIEKVFGSQK